MRRQSPDACVVGGFELVRALGSAGVRSLVVGDDGSARLSRYAVRTPNPGAGPIADVLVAALADADGPLPLFTDRDDTIVQVSAARERLAEHFLFLLPSPEIVDAVTDKARFQELAAELDLPVPPGKRIDPCHDDPSELGLGHPLVVKPLPFRNAAWRETFGAGAKALRVDRQDDLVALWPLLAGTGLEFIAQELIPGDETHIVSYHVYVDSDGDVAGEFTGRKIRTHPAEFGMSSALVTTDDEPLVRAGRGIVERLSLRGPAKLDFKRPPGGGLYLLEVNARFTLWCHPGALAGVNLPAIAYADLTGRPRPASRRAHAGVRWINPREDLAAARERGIPLRHWLPWALRCQSNPAFAWRDPGPALKHLLGR